MRYLREPKNDGLQPGLLRAMSAWDACTMEPWAVLRWIECHPGLAGYIGALGSVLAVYVAFRAPANAARFAEKQQRDIRRAEADGYVNLLRKEATNVRDEASKVMTRLEMWKEHPPGDEQWKDVLNGDLLLRPPPMLVNLYLQYDIDRDRLAPFLRLAENVTAYNNQRAVTCFNERERAKNDWFKYWTLLHERLLIVIDAASQLPG